MNWFAVSAGAGMLIVALDGYRRGRMAKAPALTLGLASAVFLAIGVDWL